MIDACTRSLPSELLCMSDAFITKRADEIQSKTPMKSDAFQSLNPFRARSGRPDCRSTAIFLVYESSRLGVAFLVSGLAGRRRKGKKKSANASPETPCRKSPLEDHGDDSASPPEGEITPASSVFVIWISDANGCRVGMPRE